MKTLVKSFFMALVAATATGAMAGITMQQIVFSAENEKYADGSPILLGEWLAVCWSNDGDFDGLKADCSTVDTDGSDAFIGAFQWPTVEGETITQIIVPTKADGAYYILRLDTRTSATTVADKNDKNLPSFVNATIKENFVGDATLASTGSFTPVGHVGSYDVKNLVNTVASLKIEPNGTGVLLKAVNLNPAVKYQVQWGDTISDLQTVPLATDAFTGYYNEEYPVLVPGGKFFRIIDVVEE